MKMSFRTKPYPQVLSSKGDIHLAKLCEVVAERSVNRGDCLVDLLGFDDESRVWMRDIRKFFCLIWVGFERILAL